MDHVTQSSSPFTFLKHPTFSVSTHLQYQVSLSLYLDHAHRVGDVSSLSATISPSPSARPLFPSGSLTPSPPVPLCIGAVSSSLSLALSFRLSFCIPRMPLSASGLFHPHPLPTGSRASPESHWPHGGLYHWSQPAQAFYLNLRQKQPRQLEHHRKEWLSYSGYSSPRALSSRPYRHLERDTQYRGQEQCQNQRCVWNWRAVLLWPVGQAPLQRHSLSALSTIPIALADSDHRMMDDYIPKVLSRTRPAL